MWVVGDATVEGSETGTSFRQALYFKDLGFNLLDTMIYRKIGMAMGSIYTYLQEFEYMFVFSKGTPKTTNLLRDRKNTTRGKVSVPIKKSDKNGCVHKRETVVQSEYGRRRNIWDYHVGEEQEEGYHPAPFPEGLARDHILSWSNVGDVVFDPMMGSGTTGKMAVAYQRNFIGIELSPAYFANAKKRIERVQQQLVLPLGDL